MTNKHSRDIYNQKGRRFRYFLKKVTGNYNDFLPDFRRGLSDAELLVQEIVDVGDLERRTQTTRDPPQDTHPHHRQIHHHTHFSTAEQLITRNQISPQQLFLYDFATGVHNSCARSFAATAPLIRHQQSRRLHCTLTNEVLQKSSVVVVAFLSSLNFDPEVLQCRRDKMVGLV